MRADQLDHGRSRAILIGVSAFDDAEFRPVPAATNSLHSMARMLTDPSLGGWPKDRVSVFPNPRETGAFQAELYDLVKDAQEALLVYFVGHGTLSTMNELCLALSDTRADLAEVTGVPYTSVKKILQSSPALVKTVILDCCYSGRAIEALGGDSAANASAMAGVTTITAADWAAHVVPLEQQHEASTSFTSHLIALIEEGRPNGHPTLTVHELYPMLKARLAEHGLPEPNWRTTDTAALFPLARNTAEAKPAVPAAREPGARLAKVIWRPSGKTWYDVDGRPYGETGQGEETQLEADRKFWRIARHHFPDVMKALIVSVDGEVNRVREVFGVDEAETARVGGAKLALEVSPPLTAAEIAQRLPGLPVTLGSPLPPVQGPSTKYLSF